MPKATASRKRPATKTAKTKRPATKRPAAKRPTAKRPAAKRPATKPAAPRPAVKQPTRPAPGPTSAATRRQLETIRAVFAKLDFAVEEHFDPKTDTSYFHVDTGVGELEDVRVVHQPGLLSVYARFGVRPKEQHRRELERLAARLNAGLLHGCVVVTREPRLCYRTSVSYAHVAELEEGHVAGLVSDVIDMIETIDLPLILVAQGNPADAAIEKVLELEEATVLPPKSAKKVPPRRA